MAFTVNVFQALNWFCFLPNPHLKALLIRNESWLSKINNNSSLFGKNNRINWREPNWRVKLMDRKSKDDAGPDSVWQVICTKTPKQWELSNQNWAKWRFQITNTVYTFILSAHLTLNLLIEVVSTRHNDLIVWKCPNSKSSTKKTTHSHTQTPPQWVRVDS